MAPAVDQGEISGDAEPFGSKEFFAAMKTKMPSALSPQGGGQGEVSSPPERSEGSGATSNGVRRSGRKVLRSAQDDKMKALRAALDEGEASGDFGPFDFKKFIASKKAKAP